MSSITAKEQAAPQPHASAMATRLAIMAVGGVLLVMFIDQTALNAALPTLVRAFHSDADHLKLAVTSYLLIQSLIVPASAWAADRFGVRRLFSFVTFVFMAASLLCGLSRSLEAFVISRTLQGAGAAMMIPLGRAIVVGVSPRHEMVKSMALLTAPMMAGPLIGPPLTGYILSAASWPWIFYINVPIALFAIVAVWAFVPRLPQGRAGRFDMAGYGLVALAIGGATVVVETAGLPRIGWQAPAAAALLALAAGWAFARRRNHNPVLDLNLFRLETYRISTVGGALVRTGINGALILAPLLLQVRCGWSPLKAGLIMMAATGGSLLPCPFAAAIMRTWGFRGALSVNVVVLAGSCALLGAVGPATSPWLIGADLLVYGVSSSIIYIALSAILYAEIGSEAVGRATALSTAIVPLVAGGGVTLGVLLLNLLGGGEAQGLRGLGPAYLALGLLLLSALPVFLKLAPDAGADMHAPPPAEALG